MIDTANISKDIVEELNYLSNKIDKNLANQEDYSRYRTLLNKAGIDDATIEQKLSKFNIHNLDEFYQKRQQENTTRSTEGRMLGVVLGLALVVAFFWALSQDKKK